MDLEKGKIAVLEPLEELVDDERTEIEQVLELNDMSYQLELSRKIWQTIEVKYSLDQVLNPIVEGEVLPAIEQVVRWNLDPDEFVAYLQARLNKLDPKETCKNLSRRSYSDCFANVLANAVLEAPRDLFCGRA